MPASAASPCRRSSRSIRRRLSISISTGCRAGCSEKKRMQRLPPTLGRRLPNDRAVLNRDSIGHQEQATISLRSEEHTSELQSPDHLVCRLLLEKKKEEDTKT